MTRRLRKAGLIVAALALAWAPAGFAQDKDLSTVVSELVVRAPPRAPLPAVGAGAPMFSMEQTESFICQAQKDGAYPLGAAIEANAATIRLEGLRVEVAAGRSSQQELAAAELERQRTVRRMLRPLTVGQLPPVQGLMFRDVAFAAVDQDGARKLRVTGSIVNTQIRPLNAQGVTVHMMDKAKFVIASRSQPLADEIIKPGERRAFTLFIDNPPRYADSVEMRFAPPFVIGNVRGCTLPSAAPADDL